MGSTAGIGVIILAGAVAVAIGCLIPVLLELRRTTQRLTAVLGIAEENLEPTLRELRGTLRNLDRITNDISAVTQDARGVSRSVRRVGRNVATLSGVVSVLAIALGVRVIGVKDGLGAGTTYLVRNLFRRGERT